MTVDAWDVCHELVTDGGELEVRYQGDVSVSDITGPGGLSVVVWFGDALAMRKE